MVNETDGRLRISSGSPYEAVAGYSRAIRVGNLVYVAGTASYKDGEVYAPGDAVAQTRQILSIIATALRGAGSGLHDVVRCRVFITASAWLMRSRPKWGAPSPASGPSAPVAVSALVHPDLVVEIEVDAVIADG